MVRLLGQKAHQILEVPPGATVETIEKAKRRCLLWCLGRKDEVGRLMCLKAASFLQEEDKRGSRRGSQERQLDVSKELARSSNFGADEVRTDTDPMPELVKCRVRVGEALRDNQCKLSELNNLKNGLSVQEGNLVDSAAILASLPKTIQMLWQEVEESMPGPQTLQRFTGLLKTVKRKVSIASTESDFMLPFSDASWVVNLAQLTDAEMLSSRLREHMLTPLHASLTAIEPVASLKAAKLCDSFLESVCKIGKICWYAEVESYLQDLEPRADMSMVNEYLDQARGWLLLDAGEIAQHACMWMDVDDQNGSLQETSRTLAKHYKMLQYLEFEGKDAALAMANLAVNTFHSAVSLLSQHCPQPLIQDADLGSRASTLVGSADGLHDEDHEDMYESIDCDSPPPGWHEPSPCDVSPSKATKDKTSI